MTRNLLLRTSLASLFLFVSWGSTSASEMPRTILSLYDSRADESEFYSNGHRLAEMPLNHLGFVVVHHDVNDALPDLEAMRDVFGVLLWSESGEMKAPDSFLEWGIAVLKARKPFVILGTLCFLEDLQGRETDRALVNRFLAMMGLFSEYDWMSITYDVELPILDHKIVGYERDLAGVLPAFERVRALDKDARIFLQAYRRVDPESLADLIVVTRNGGYVASGYTHYSNVQQDRLQWILNPFEFFRAAYSSDALPKPDTTTLSGRRIYYSHIDGDGWRNVSQIPPRSERQQLSAEVILRRVLIPYSDLPVTVGPVVADLHPDWFGTEGSREIAREIFALAHVEAGSHTFSHPFDWGFFRQWSEEKERPYLAQFDKHWDQPQGRRLRLSLARQPKVHVDARIGNNEYQKPRAFAVERFSLEHEIRGSIQYLESLMPEGKRVELYQWSGNTLPFVEALTLLDEMQVFNINGGDTRFDREFPSVAWVAPIGRVAGGHRQIYASNSNENTYTDLWTNRYFGFMHLIRTFRNTATPVRLKPLNVYYHMYSGERISALNALLANLQYARQQSICPVTAGRYAAIANGFFTTRIHAVGDDQWQIDHRGALQTIRFDRATFRSVDFDRSHGVIGQTHLQGSLYVALDRGVQRPLIALRPIDSSHTPATAESPYLIDGRWEVWGLKTLSNGFRFETGGFGRGELTWKVPEPGLYEVTIRNPSDPDQVWRWQSNANGILEMNLGDQGIQPCMVQVRRAS